MLNLNPGEVNRLRQLLAQGAISEADLAGLQINGTSGPNALARIMSPQEEFAAGGEQGALPMGSMRNEATGKVTYFKPGGGGFSDQPYGAMTQVAQPRAKVRVVGVGDGQVTELGEEDMRAEPIDYTRGGIDIPGVGKGYYSRDGRFAYVDDGQGGRTKVILGYDAEASDRRTARSLQQRKLAAEADLSEQKAGLGRVMLAQAQGATATDAGPQALSQKQLEEIHGKPDKGMRWTQDGKLEPLPGGEVESQSALGLKSMQTAVENIDALIGKRDKDGKLLAGSQPHPGFESAVGVSIPKALGAGFIPGTETTDFNARLDQLKGGAFLQAFETLKGGGQITEVEGKKATAAITRMNTAQSEAEFIAAAREFRDAVEAGMAKLSARSGGKPAGMPQGSAEPAGAPSAAVPKLGEIRRGYVFTGGDPASPSSWKRVR